MTFSEQGADVHSTWAKNAPHRGRAYKIFHSFGWFIFSEPENTLYADHDKDVRIGSLETVISVMAALDWTAEGWGSIPASTDALPTIRYVLDLCGDVPLESAVTMHKMGLSLSEARNVIHHGIDIEMLSAVEGASTP